MARPQARRGAGRALRPKIKLHVSTWHGGDTVSWGRVPGIPAQPTSLAWRAGIWGQLDRRAAELRRCPTLWRSALRSDRPKQARINRLRYRRLGRHATGFRRRPPAPLTEAGRASRDRKALAPTKLCNVKFVRAGPGLGQQHGPASGLVRRPLLRGCGRTTRWRRAAGRGWARSSPMSG
jgi:hypothetical protein